MSPREEFGPGFGKLFVLCWAALALGCAVLWAQDDTEFVPGDPEGESSVDYGTVDDILAQEEGLLSEVGGYNYDPGARRDPFRSLLQRNAPSSDAERERPDGPGGLLIDEIEIEGIFILHDGPVVQVQSSSQETSYLLRPGDQLWDGDVVSISLQEVVFKQSVNDPTALKPFREVVRRLNP